MSPEQINVSILSNFGYPPRGVSFYSNGLAGALERLPSVDLHRMDYFAAYPRSLFPGALDDDAQPVRGIVHWGRPATWRKAADLSEKILHMQYWTAISSPYLSSIAYHAKRQGKRVIVTHHNPRQHESLPAFRHWEKKLVGLADRIIVHGEHGRQVLLSSSRNVKESSVRVVPHGIELNGPGREDAQADYAIVGVKEGYRYVVLFGNLRGYKGLLPLLDAWGEVRPQFKAYTRLVVAGRFWGGRGSVLSGLAARLLGTKKFERVLRSRLERTRKDESVILREGFLTDNEIDSLCRLADICVFPYERFDGQSGAAVKAAGWGCPLLVTGTGELPSLVVDPDQVLDPGDHRQLAGRLMDLFSDHRRLKDLRKRQWENIQKFSWENIAQLHCEVYRELL